MEELLSKRDRLIFGALLQIAIMIAALVVIMHSGSGAAAAEFAALGIMLGAIVVTPVAFIGNLSIALQRVDTRMRCFKRGMMAPGVILIGALVSQTGFWDAIT